MQRRARQGGWLLVELLIAATVLALGVLGFLFAFQSNFKASQEIACRDLVQQALTAGAERLQEEDLSTLYAAFQGAKLPASVPDLKDADGLPARVEVHFDVDETALPPEYGPVLDIDGDGEMKTADASTGYLILPCRLTVTYQMPYGRESKSLHVVLGR